VAGIAVALAVAAGLAGAVQAAVMGELGGRVGVFPALAFAGVVAVVLGLVLLLLARQSLRGLWVPVQRFRSSRANRSGHADYLHVLVSDTVTRV
jgi:hypothetical protein